MDVELIRKTSLAHGDEKGVLISKRKNSHISLAEVKKHAFEWPKPQDVVSLQSGDRGDNFERNSDLTGA